VRVAQLQLANFRNYRRLTLDLPPGPSVIVGGNGQGKTNLLDALHILASAQSLRPGPEAAWVRFDAPAAEGFARLRAQITSDSGACDGELIVARTRPDDGETSGVRRRARVDGALTRLADLPGRLLAVSFAPADLNLWTGAPSGRRRWLDLAVAQVDQTYTAHLTTYENILTRRNALLRRLQGGLGRPTELEFWDDRISEPAVAVTRARAAYVAHVRAPVNLGFEAMRGGARLDLAYRASGLGLDAQGYRVALQQRRNRDIQRGASGLGPRGEVRVRAVFATTAGAWSESITVSTSPPASPARCPPPATRSGSGARSPACSLPTRRCGRPSTRSVRVRASSPEGSTGSHTSLSGGSCPGGPRSGSSRRARSTSDDRTADRVLRALGRVRRDPGAAPRAAGAPGRGLRA